INRPDIKPWLSTRNSNCRCWIWQQHKFLIKVRKSLPKVFRSLVFCAYTFILWHQLTGGLRRRWANKSLNTFTEANNAFRTAISFRFFHWLTLNRDLFAAYKASLGYIWA
ncbi:MAG: IS701 family transposase, partial [Nostoc sp.]